METQARPALINEPAGIISSIPGGIVVTKADCDFTLLYVNAGYYSLMGFSPDEHFAKFGAKGKATIHPNDTEILTKSIKEQITASNCFSVTARIIHKTRGYINAHLSGHINYSSDGIITVSVVVVDITSTIGAYQQLEREQSINNLIDVVTDDAFFDYDLEANTVRYSRNIANRLGIDEVVINYPHPLLKMGLIANDSIYISYDDIVNTKDGILEDETHFKLPDGGDVWYAGRYSVIRDNSGVPIRMIGKLSDITKHKIRINELSTKAEQDQLTGLYNKVTTEYLITEILKMRRFHDDRHALMIIDVDNFKNINDRLGHLFGDIVLAQLAEVLKPLFRSDDIIGRIGGDEFFVFLKNYNSIKVLQSKAGEICRGFDKTYTQNGVTVRISASIGIALCPEHGTNFDVLYECADTALYTVKERGKNDFLIYSGQTSTNYHSSRTEIDMQGHIQKSFKDNRVEYIFKLLYEAENHVSSIHSVLKLITEHFDFSRGYIFENSEDNRYSSNTFEWCADGVEPEIENLQNLPMANMVSALQLLETEGVCVVRTLSDMSPDERAIIEPQGIKSMLHFAIRDNGKLIGFVGFDDCVNERDPAPDMIDEIGTICHILGTFLLKYRSLETERKSNAALASIVENIGTSIYIVDRQTYEVLYENRSALEIIGNPAVGKLCYTACVNRSAPCEACPMNNFVADSPHATAYMYNEKIKANVKVVATMIKWHDNENACLLSCTVDT